MAQPGGASRLDDAPQPVTGFGEVGVTWASASPSRSRRSRSRPAPAPTAPGRPGRTIPYDPEHGPDPGSAEARHARPGTDPLLVGKVDSVQVRAVSTRARSPPT